MNAFALVVGLAAALVSALVVFVASTADDPTAILKRVSRESGGGAPWKGQR